MRVAIIGSAGQLGSELLSAFADMQPIGLRHEDVELQAPEAVARFLGDERPELVINTAAFHNVEACENEPERAFAVNALAVGRLASACAAVGCAVAHISTDYVFDGKQSEPYRENDATLPLNAYGISKLAGELLLTRGTSRYFVFRTSGLYAARGRGSKGLPFIERILQSADRNVPLRVVDDITCSPSNAKHVARAIRRVVEREVYGIYHVTNSGACTWHDFAAEIVRQAGYDVPIERTSRHDNPSAVKRPPFSALSNRAMSALGLPAMPSWQTGISEYIEERAKIASEA